MNFREYLKESKDVLISESLKKGRAPIERWLNELGFELDKFKKINESNVETFGGSAHNTWKRGTITKDGDDTGYITVKINKVTGMGTDYYFYISSVDDSNTAYNITSVQFSDDFEKIVKKLKL